MGASGCGKTTLINSLVGIDSLDSGDIEVFGESPGKNKSRIGFMPQETALISEFTIRETIWFYGTIFGLSASMIDEKINFLRELLELPEEDKFIRDCSGGQQRRVSFAVTLIHEPELLILDEPTVGVDPLLRAKIWDYLVELTVEKKVTVLLSTHYIEEAKQSTHVGLMRNGVLVAEDSPQNVLQSMEASNLEEAFWKLSQMQEIDVVNQNTVNSFEHRKPKLAEIEPSTFSQRIDDDKRGLKPSTLKILQALLMKNFMVVLRNAE
jgi:ABC-type multidrug transport system ATPase subunit